MYTNITKVRLLPYELDLNLTSGRDIRKIIYKYCQIPFLLTIFPVLNFEISGPKDAPRGKSATAEEQYALELAYYKSYMKKHPGAPATIHYSGRGRWGEPEEDPNESADESNRGDLVKLRDVDRDVIALAYLSQPAMNLTYSLHAYFPPCKELNSRPDLWHYRIRPCTIKQIQELGYYDKDYIAEDEYHPDTRFWIVDIEINITW